MCDYFWQRMENDHGDLADIVRAGDLADIVRAGGQSGHSPNAGAVFEPADDWQRPNSEPAFFPTRSSAAGVIPGNGFGDPFVSLGDPLLDPYAAAGSEFFDGAAVASSSSGCGDGVERFLAAPRTAAISKVHQICAGAGIDSCSSSLPRMDHAGAVQISSPRTPGIKRRKGQAKKVVCIPAPAAAASNRPTGEVVPSDLWAWRKYGQKPIKGSPYPRGYYRCSSSKGCSARKQVERSRTDPNMLVITYTSEHNHPWPTQRNALAGSIRSHASKNAGILKSQKPSKEEDPNETTTHLIKQEATENMEKATSHQAHQGATDHHHLDQLIAQSYKPMIPDDSDQPDDFFSDLAELDSDPMSLIFSKAFMEAKADEEDKALPPFRMFD